VSTFTRWLRLEDLLPGTGRFRTSRCSNSGRSRAVSRSELSIPRHHGAGGLVGAKIFHAFD
jgi:hypothetical protein